MSHSDANYNTTAVKGKVVAHKFVHGGSGGSSPTIRKDVLLFLRISLRDRTPAIPAGLRGLEYQCERKKRVSPMVTLSFLRKNAKMYKPTLAGREKTLKVHH